MRPLLWTKRAAAIGAIVPAIALLMVELRSSRTADRYANQDDRIVDRTTGRLFDLAAGTALIAGVVASVGVPSATIHQRVTTFAIGTTCMSSALALSASARSELGRFHRNALTVHVDQPVVDSGPYVSCVAHTLGFVRQDGFRLHEPDRDAIGCWFSTTCVGLRIGHRGGGVVGRRALSLRRRRRRVRS